MKHPAINIRPTLPAFVALAFLLLGIAHADSRVDQARESGVWPVQSGDSLYRIAKKLFPNERAKQLQLSEQLHALNPEAFRNNDPNRLRVNVSLTLPSFAINTAETDEAEQPAIEVAASTEPAASKTPTPVPTPEPVAQTAVTLSPAGRVLFARGGMTARQSSGAVRALERDSSVYQGDTITTPRRGFGQLQLADGALLAIRPSTELVIEEFRYNGAEDGTESSVLRLIRGGFRTITGAIGQINKRQYRVNTLVATVGIRGTHYGLRFCEPGCTLSDGSISQGLFGGVADGEISVANNSGETGFGQSQYFRVASIDEPPVRLPDPPNVVFDGDESASGDSDEGLLPDPLMFAVTDPVPDNNPSSSGEVLDEFIRSEPNLGVEPTLPSNNPSPPPGEPPPIDPPTDPPTDPPPEIQPELQ